jgi:single-strand DNA-binding protein
MISNLNSLLIEGVLKEAPLYRLTPKGVPVCTLVIVSKQYRRDGKKSEEEIGFFQVRAGSKLADACNAQGREGRGLRVVGRLKEERWVGPDGKPRSKVFIVADHVEWRPEYTNEAQ